MHLEKIHKSGIILGNIRFENIGYFESEQSWKLIDFEIATRMDQFLTIEHEDLSFVAPEIKDQIENGNKTILPSPSIDVYSLGCIGWECFQLKGKVFVQMDVCLSCISDPQGAVHEMDAFEADFFEKLLSSDSTTRLSPSEAIQHEIFKHVRSINNNLQT